MAEKLPDTWVKTELKNLAIIRSGGTPSRSNKSYWNGNIPWVKISDLNGFYVMETKEFITEKGLNNSAARIFPKGTILFTIFATIGKVGVLKIDATTNQAIAGITPSHKINSQYLTYSLIELSNEILGLGKGIAQKNINQTILKDTLIPLPPLAEQERIVKKLDDLFERLDKIKTSLDKIPVLLRNFRQQVLTQAVTGKLTEEWRKGKDFDAREVVDQVLEERKRNGAKIKILPEVKEQDFPFGLPASWCFSYLQYFGELTRGRSKHRPRNDPRLFDGKYPFIQTGEVARSNGYITEYNKTLSDFGLKQSRYFPKGTLCITIAANIAETGILGFDSCFPDSVVGYLPFKDFYNVKFAMYYLNTIQQDLEHYAPATAQKNINLGILFKVAFPVPPKEEQQEIVSRVESLFSKADQIQEKYENLKTKIEQLPQAILHKASKGELVPQLESDGDARDLLREIQNLDTKIN